MIRLYKWIERFKTGRRTNKKSLWRTCKRRNVPRPSSLTEAEVTERIQYYTMKLGEITEKGPKLREEHLAARLATARKNKKKAAIKGIMKIMRTEANRKQWRRIGNCIRPQRGSAISRVVVPDEVGERMYSTREGVETIASTAIAERYKTARGAPILRNEELHRDFGFLANTESTAQVLQGTYVYPQSTERYTLILLQEAHEIYKQLPEGDVPTFLSVREYQQFWRYKAKADTQSSISGVHFEHYIVASYDKDLSILQSAKLSLAASTGIPLARWGKGLTILLEKVPGAMQMASF